MKKVFIAVVIMAISILMAFAGYSYGRQLPHDMRYSVDRIEEGANGEQWLVVEVYDETADHITYMDILVKPGYLVE